MPKPKAKTEPEPETRTKTGPESEGKEESKPDAKADPKAQAEPESKAEPKPETKAEPKPETKVKLPFDLTPQLIKRVHELYEELRREEVRAVEKLEKAERESHKDEPDK